MRNLNKLAAELYAKLYAESDELPPEELEEEFRRTVPEERKRTLKNAIVWLRDQPVSAPLESLLPDFYALTWARENTPEFQEYKQAAQTEPDVEIGNLEPLYSAMQNIRNYFQKHKHH